MSIKLNSKGMIADYAPTSQFYAGETEFACGFYTSALNKYAGAPGSGPAGSPQQVRAFAEQQYIDVYGSDRANQTGGISIPELHTVLHNAGNLHYWDMPVDANSAHNDDIRRIKAALGAGYAVIATITEVSVRDLTGDIPAGSPYEWTPSGTHVITWVGVASDGNLLAADPANVVGPLQGDNHTRPWPRKYDASTIDNTFATIVQLPWLKTIPSGDPLAWPAGYNAQNFAPAPSGPSHEALAIWNSTTLGGVPVGKNAPVEAGIFPAGKVPSISTGIAGGWLAEYRAGRCWGPPVSYEFPSEDENGKPIILQMFVGGFCKWNGTAHFQAWPK